jgi:hypothetical protein
MQPSSSVERSRCEDACGRRACKRTNKQNEQLVRKRPPPRRQHIQTTTRSSNAGGHTCVTTARQRKRDSAFPHRNGDDAESSTSVTRAGIFSAVFACTRRRKVVGVGPRGGATSQQAAKNGLPYNTSAHAVPASSWSGRGAGTSRGSSARTGGSQSGVGDERRGARKKGAGAVDASKSTVRRRAGDSTRRRRQWRRRRRR